MNINEISLQSKKRAEEIAKVDGGIVVQVYAVIKVDELGRVRSITHDRLEEVIAINTFDGSICFFCKDEFHTCEGSSYRFSHEEDERREVVCADCAYNPDEKIAKYNQSNVKRGDTVYSFLNKRAYYVSLVDDHGIYTNSEGYSFPNTPRLDFKDFVIL